MLIAVYSRPIADDWGFLAKVGHLSTWSWFRTSWLHRSDRFSAFLLVWTTVKLLGANAINVVPIALELTLWVFVSWALRCCARIAGSDLTRLEAGLIGLLAVVAAIATAPSPFDTAGWFANTAIYLAGPTAAVGAVLVWLRATGGAGRASRRGALIVGIAGLMAAGFDEIIGATIVLGALFAIALSARTWRSREGLLALALGAAIGTIVAVLGPGSRQRAAEQNAHVNLVAAVHTAGHNLGFVVEGLNDGVIALAVAVGVLVWLAVNAQLGPRTQRQLVAWAGFLIAVPWLMTSALTTWGGSLESGGRSPFRVAFLISGSVAVAVALLTIASLARFPLLLKRSGASLLALALVVGGSAGLAVRMRQTITAERMRAHALTLRSRSVAAALDEHRSTITLTPAPLLSVDTQAYDLSFAPLRQQRGWVVALVRQYYGIPGGTRIQIVARQPRDYCLPNVSASWVGVQSCQELAAARA